MILLKKVQYITFFVCYLFKIFFTAITNYGLEVLVPWITLVSSVALPNRKHICDS